MHNWPALAPASIRIFVELVWLDCMLGFEEKGCCNLRGEFETRSLSRSHRNSAFA